MLTAKEARNRIYAKSPLTWEENENFTWEHISSRIEVASDKGEGFVRFSGFVSLSIQKRLEQLGYRVTFMVGNEPYAPENLREYTYISW